MSLLLSAGLAYSFTRPLNKMKKTAVLLASGDYSAKTDIEQKDEIGELAEALDIMSLRLFEARQESEKLEKLRREFVANISHELKTPVTVLRGSLEALCDDVVTEPLQVKSYHEQMLVETLHLQRLINDLLDLSRLQNTDFKIESSDISLCEVMSDALRSAESLAAKKGIKILKAPSEQVCAIKGDYGRLRQMLLIVLDNAVKFSPEGSEISVSLGGNILSISDRGIGIPESELPFIFDRFYKTKSEDNKSGSGLGLAIAKQIAERHGIAITAESRDGEGTTFKFVFPQ
jgi:signal transduction histidine kinase